MPAKTMEGLIAKIALIASGDNTVEIIPPGRDAYGRWLRGTPSPNLSGCIPKDGREVLELAREGSPAAMRPLIAIVNDEEAPANSIATRTIAPRMFLLPSLAWAVSGSF
jgi:hypothetical protein